MSAFVMSYPFSIDAVNRRFSTVSTDTDTYKAQQVSAFLKCRKDERSLMPSFGINDPTFHVFDASAFASDFIDFYPANGDLVLKDIELTKNAGVVTSVAVKFE